MKASQENEFEEAVKPLMKWLAENKNPHTKVILDSTTAEIVEGVYIVKDDQFITD